MPISLNNIVFGVCKLIKQVIESYMFSIIVQENVLFSGKIYTVGKNLHNVHFVATSM